MHSNVGSSCVWCTLILLPFFCQDLLDLFFSQEILNAKRWLSKPLFPNTVPGSKKERIFHFHYWCVFWNMYDFRKRFCPNIISLDIFCWYYFKEWLVHAFPVSTLCHFCSVISTITATTPVEMTSPTGCLPMLPYPWCQ